MSRSGFYAGPLSWTGTMFEYHMPLLRPPGGALLCEGLRYCLYCQEAGSGQSCLGGSAKAGTMPFDGELQLPVLKPTGYSC